MKLTGFLLTAFLVTTLLARADLLVDAPFDPKGGHIQGMCFGDGHYYLSQASHLFKIDLKGKCVRHIPAIVHTGDLCWHQGRLYTSIAVYQSKRGVRKGQGGIQVFDADLNLVKEKFYPRSMDGIDFLNGKLYVGSGCHRQTLPHEPDKEPNSKTPHLENDLVLVNPETLEIEKTFCFSHGYQTHYGAQNIVSDGRKLYLSFYPVKKGEPDLVSYDAEMKPLRHWVANASNGFVITGEEKGMPIFLKCKTVRKNGVIGAVLKKAQLTPVGTTKQRNTVDQKGTKK